MPYNVYVSNRADGTVSVVDIASLTVTDVVTVGAQPTGLVVTPANTFVYVVNSFTGTPSVMAIDVTTNLVTATIPISDGAQGDTDIAITPDGATVYVCNQGFASVTPITVATNTALTPITLPGSPAIPLGICIDPTGTYAYVTDTDSGTGVIQFITVATNSIAASPLTEGGANMNGIAIMPNGAFVYVANQLTGTISWFATGSFTPVVNTLAISLAPTSIKVTPDNLFAYIATANGVVLVMSMTSNTIVHSILINETDEIHGVSITPDGQFVFVVDLDTDTLYQIATATNAVVGTVTVGGAPIGTAISPAQATGMLVMVV